MKHKLYKKSLKSPRTWRGSVDVLLWWWTVILDIRFKDWGGESSRERRREESQELNIFINWWLLSEEDLSGETNWWEGRISEKSRGSSVSYSLVKTQQIKCYQPQRETSHLKLNMTNFNVPQCQTDKTVTADREQRVKVLVLWSVRAAVSAGKFCSCVTARLYSCVFVFNSCFLVTTKLLRHSMPWNYQQHIVSVGCRLENISKHE